MATEVWKDGKTHKVTRAKNGEFGHGVGSVASKATGWAQQLDSRISGKASTRSRGGAAPSSDEVRAAFGGMTSRVDAESYLAGLKLTAPQVKQLAKDLGIPLRSGMRKGDAQKAIVDHAVGGRLVAAAIRDTTVLPDLDQVSRPLTPAPVKRTAQTPKAPTPAEWAEALGKARNPLEIDGMLAGKNATELRAIAKASGVAVPSRATKPQIEDALRRWATGSTPDVPTAPAQPSGEADRVGRYLDRVMTREAATEYLNGLNLTAPQMRDLARDLGAGGTGSKAEQVRRLVEMRVGSRLQGMAIAGMMSDGDSSIDVPKRTPKVSRPKSAAIADGVDAILAQAGIRENFGTQFGTAVMTGIRQRLKRGESRADVAAWVREQAAELRRTGVGENDMNGKLGYSAAERREIKNADVSDLRRIADALKEPSAPKKAAPHPKA